MNEKKCKALRKVCNRIGNDELPVISFYRRVGKDAMGEAFAYEVIKPLFHPEGSKRRLYQDGKKFMGN